MLRECVVTHAVEVAGLADKCITNYQYSKHIIRGVPEGWDELDRLQGYVQRSTQVHVAIAS